MIAAIADGTIDVIASGHDPRGPEDKRLPFADAEPGMAGAETLLPLTLTPLVAVLLSATGVQVDLGAFALRVATVVAAPFAIAAVELEAEGLIVLGKVVEGTLAADLKVGMEMELATMPLYTDDDGVTRTVYAWKKVDSNA